MNVRFGTWLKLTFPKYANVDEWKAALSRISCEMDNLDTAMSCEWKLIDLALFFGAHSFGTLSISQLGFQTRRECVVCLFLWRRWNNRRIQNRLARFLLLAIHAANAKVAAESAADNNNNSSSSDIFDVNTDVTPLTHCGARNDRQLAPPRF